MFEINIAPDLRLPPKTRVALLSDVHLGDGSRGDLFGTKDDLLLDVLAREGDAADIVVINGDAVDHMQARSTKRMERAHPRIFEALRNLSRRKPVVYVLGNHEDPADLRQSFPDFDYVSALRVGDDLCIAHGHQFDLHWKDGGGVHVLAKVHSFLETHGRAPIRQPFRDYDNAMNRVVHRIFFRYTQALRLRGWLFQKFGRLDFYETWRQVDNFWARGQWGDLGCIFQTAERYLLSGEAPWRTLVLGHSHQPGVVAVGPQREHIYANIGTWALDLATFGRIEDGVVRVFDARTGAEFRDERYHMLLSGSPLPDMAGWFERYYRGFLRYDVEAITRDFPRIPDPGA